ncbi:MAG TPA: chorismate synthase [Rhodospirillales bacterium]|nr:chorismate synthase [Rhodospirillales bacterium]
MTGNTFGKFFTVTSFGESHGPAIGCVIDGVPPRMALSQEDIQPYVDKRRPGQSKYTTARQEPDTVEILSGVFEGQSTGTPIGLMIVNKDARSKDYGEIRDKFRPGHADYTYFQKYGIRDYRGGGRSSARETAMRVAAGAVARKVLDHVLDTPVIIRAAMVQMGSLGIERSNWDWDEICNNPFCCPDAEAVKPWQDHLDEIRSQGSSTGAVIEVVASGIPAGLGAPVFDRLDADIAKALMSIPAVKGIEIGAGFDAAALTGPENADQMSIGEDGKVHFASNNAGGVLGGISSGQDLVARFAVKPTSSISMPLKSVNTRGENVEIATRGRHDPCVGIRAVPIGEAMVAIVLADHLLRHKGQCGD